MDTTKSRLDYKSFIETFHAKQVSDAIAIIGPPSPNFEVEQMAKDVVQACRSFVLRDPVRVASASHERRIAELEKRIEELTKPGGIA